MPKDSAPSLATAKAFTCTCATLHGLFRRIHGLDAAGCCSAQDDEHNLPLQSIHQACRRLKLETLLLLDEPGPMCWQQVKLPAWLCLHKASCLTQSSHPSSTVPSQFHGRCHASPQEIGQTSHFPKFASQTYHLLDSCGPLSVIPKKPSVPSTQPCAWIPLSLRDHQRQRASGVSTRSLVPAPSHRRSSLRSSFSMWTVVQADALYV